MTAAFRTSLGPALALAIALACLACLGPPSRAGEDLSPQTTAYNRRPFTLRLAAYANRRACWLFGNINVSPQQQGPDPTTIALLQRIADQQQAVAVQLQMMTQQQRPAQTDPALLSTLSQLAAQQDRIIQAINDNKVSDAGTQALLKEMITGQSALIAALGKPTQPPVIVTPPAPPPPVIVTPPGTPPAGSPLPGLPNTGGIQALPGPGGSLQLIPPAGGTIQALPGPGGSLQILPGGVKPPEAKTDPGKPPTTPVTPLPGGGLLIPLPETPMSPLPGAGGPLTIPVKGPLRPIRYSTFPVP